MYFSYFLHQTDPTKEKAKLTVAMRGENIATTSC